VPVHQNLRDCAVLTSLWLLLWLLLCHSAGYTQRLPILQKAVSFGVNWFQQGRQ
jgi:hypothetical protein